MQRNRQRRSNLGFTLIELMVVTAIIGILAAISLSSFRLYHERAADMNAFATLASVRKSVEASIIDDNDGSLNAVSYVQNTPGLSADADARALLGNFNLPSRLTVALDYDPTCLDSSCAQESIGVVHSGGRNCSTYLKLGDDSYVLTPKVPKTDVSCP